jgi:hypothetical protein
MANLLQFDEFSTFGWNCVLAGRIYLDLRERFAWKHLTEIQHYCFQLPDTCHVQLCTFLHDIVFQNQLELTSLLKLFKASSHPLMSAVLPPHSHWGWSGSLLWSPFIWPWILLFDVFLTHDLQASEYVHPPLERLRETLFTVLCLIVCGNWICV